MATEPRRIKAHMHGLDMPATELEHDAECFCPFCGKQGEVWRETGQGDYYAGCESFCLACGAQFFLSGGVDEKARDGPRFARLREAARGGA
jgi:hypothetical protein